MLLFISSPAIIHATNCVHKARAHCARKIQTKDVANLFPTDEHIMVSKIRFPSSSSFLSRTPEFALLFSIKDIQLGSDLVT